MKINCYGEITDDASLAFRMAHTPLEIKRLGEWTFARYTEGESSAIHRFKVGEDGAVEEMWSYGKWVTLKSSSMFLLIKPWRLKNGCHSIQSMGETSLSSPLDSDDIRRR